MRKSAILQVCAIGFLGLFIFLGCCHASCKPSKEEIKKVDVNKDGKPDVTYHIQGEYVTKVEADTNYDGKPDVTVYTKDGEFQSAEADTNYDGKPDKRFNNAKEFNTWINHSHPDFKDSFNYPDWQVSLLKF